MMAHLKKQAHRYFDAIDMSINCSDQGIVFSEHALDLCHALETKMPATEILKLIKCMEIQVSQAQKDVEKTRARFIDVRGQLIKVRTVIGWVASPRTHSRLRSRSAFLDTRKSSSEMSSLRGEP
jgi:hypothetical protein